MNMDAPRHGSRTILLVKWAIEMADGSNYSCEHSPQNHKTEYRSAKKGRAPCRGNELVRSPQSQFSELTRAQRLARKHVKQGTSLVDELLAERREAARNE